MKKHPKLYIELVTITLLIMMSCSSDLPEVVWEGENVLFASENGELPCGETLEFLDNGVRKIGDMLGAPLPPGNKLKYYWLSEELASQHCGSGHSNCAANSTIISVHPYIPHEIVHILAERLGRAHPFFTEGLAVAFGEKPEVPFFQQDIVGDIEKSLVPYLSADEVNYPVAGFFTRYLIETYGLSAYKEIYEASSPGSDNQDIDSILKYFLGVELKDILSSIRELPQEQVHCYAPPPLCLHEVHPWQSESVWEYQINTGCDDEDALGPFSQDYSESSLLLTIEDDELQFLAGFEIGEFGRYDVSIAAPDNIKGMAYIRPCFTPEKCNIVVSSLRFGDWSDLDFEVFPNIEVVLEKGIYQIEFHFYAPHSDGEIVEASIERL